MNNKIAHMGLFCATAIVLGYVETLIPFSFGIPGVKLGLANLAVLLVLLVYTWKEAAVVSLVRILVIGFLFGNLFSILYSLAGAGLSLLVMTLLKRTGGFGQIGVSVAGGVCHNIGQLAVVLLLFQSWGYLYYLPVLLISGAATGFVIGTVVLQVEKRIGAFLKKC
ncbi:MAG: Gx transporter family protein [Blautia sp.]